MSTKKLISALNAACGCSDYNGISISFLSAEDYCIDKNTPTELCSYGHIKINPYLTAVRNYSFEKTYVEGVDFGDCDMLEEIGTSHHSCLPDSCLHVFMSSSLAHSLAYFLHYTLTRIPFVYQSNMHFMMQKSRNLTCWRARSCIPSDILRLLTTKSPR